MSYSDRALLSTISRLAEIGLWEVDLSNQHVFWSDVVCAIHEVPPGTQPSLSEALDYYVSRQHDDIQRAFLDCARHGRSFDRFADIMSASGRRKTVHVIGEAVMDNDDHIFRLHGTLQEVNLHHTLTMDLERERHFQHALLESLSEGIVACDADGVLTQFNRSTRELHGQPEQPLPAEQWAQHYNLYRPDGKTLMTTEEVPLYRALKGEEVNNVEMVIMPAHAPPRRVVCRGRQIITPAGEMLGAVVAMNDITESKMVEKHLAHVNRSLLLVSACNESLIRATEEQQLLDEICQMAVDIGDYRMAWVGYAEQDEQQTIRPVAMAGIARDYLASVQISWSSDKPIGQGPAGIAIRSGAPATSTNTQTDPRFQAWREQARTYGMNSALCLPLKSQGQAFGVFCLYSVEAQYFKSDEINLLQELADNMAFGIASLRSEHERKKLHSTLVQVAASVSGISNSGFFEQLVRSMVEVTNASIGCITQVDRDNPDYMQTLALINEGEFQDNLTSRVQATPCRELLQQREYFIFNNVASEYPEDVLLANTDMQAFAGARLENADGRLIGFIFAICREANSQPTFVHSALQIFAARAAAELERVASDQRIHEQAELLNKAHEAIIVQDTQQIVRYWNEGAKNLYGWTADEVVGQSLIDILHEDAEIMAAARQAVLTQGEWRGELQQRRKDGTSLVVEAHWSLVKTHDEDGFSILAINTDITERKAAEQQVQHLAYYDSLTQLPNRSLLMQRLQHALVVSDRSGHSGAILFIDLDNFKVLNDTLGHDVGDQLLRRVGERIQDTVRNSDTVARLGGDEFVVLLENLDADPGTAAVQAETVANKILETLGQTYQLDQYEYFSTPSIGITQFNGLNESVEELLKRADIAMYQAKTAGRNTVRFFDPEMQSHVTERVALDNDLRKALDNNEFSLHYQPQVTNEGRILGAEALIRWQHPARGNVPPFDFISLAEETGQIQRIGAWVLKTACESLARWSRDPVMRDYMLCVNVSVQQFRHPEFVQQVRTVLEETNVRPSLLGLEITESLFLDNVEDTIAKMAELQKLGLSFSLDDFGTGYSSLSYLKQLPLNQLKIDRSFVSDVLDNDNDAVIAKTIINLAHSMSLIVVAEGVETEAQRQFLGRHGCDAYQGYLFSPALPLEQFEAWSHEMVRQPLQG